MPELTIQRRPVPAHPHAAFDNQSGGGRVRVSCDTRFQPESEPMDERLPGRTRPRTAARDIAAWPPHSR